MNFSDPKIGYHSGGCNVYRCRAFCTLFSFKRHLLPLIQGLVAVAIDRRMVNENILATFVGRDKAKAFSGIEPLDSSSTHKQLPYKKLKVHYRRNRLPALFDSYGNTRSASRSTSIRTLSHQHKHIYKIFPRKLPKSVNF